MYYIARMIFRIEKILFRAPWMIAVLSGLLLRLGVSAFGGLPSSRDADLRL